MKRYGYEARVNKHGKRFAVKISAKFVERHGEIKEQVIEVLCRKLENTKDEEKKQIIIKHIKRLTQKHRERSRRIPMYNVHSYFSAASGSKVIKYPVTN